MSEANEIKRHRRKKSKIRKIWSITWKILLLFIFYKIASPFLFLPSEIKELNRNVQFTHFDFKFGDKLSEINVKQLKEDGWTEDIQLKRYRYIYYFHMNNGAIGFQGFPDLSNEFKFVSYGVDKKENLRVFGISVGDNIVKAHESLINFAYKVDIDGKSRTYYKGRIKINITERHGEIIGISIRLENTDWLSNGYYK